MTICKARNAKGQQDPLRDKGMKTLFKKIFGVVPYKFRITYKAFWSFLESK